MTVIAKRKRSRSAKGGKYERVVCRKLSLWFSDDKFDDWFWRSAGSGSRATTRAKTGKRTTGHDSDISPTCPEGAEFTDRITLEIKIGYNRSAYMADLLDCKTKPKCPPKGSIYAFIDQAQKAAKNAGTKCWMLVHKRDGREALVYFPLRVADRVSYLHTTYLNATFRLDEYLDGGDSFVVMRFDDFLALVKPKHILDLPKGKKK